MFIAGDKIIIAWELFGADRDARITPISRQFRDLRVNLNAMNSLERMKERGGRMLFAKNVSVLASRDGR